MPWYPQPRNDPYEVPAGPEYLRAGLDFLANLATTLEEHKRNKVQDEREARMLAIQENQDARAAEAARQEQIDLAYGREPFDVVTGAAPIPGPVEPGEPDLGSIPIHTTMRRSEAMPFQQIAYRYGLEEDARETAANQWREETDIDKAYKEIQGRAAMINARKPDGNQPPYDPRTEALIGNLMEQLDKSEAELAPLMAKASVIPATSRERADDEIRKALLMATSQTTSLKAQILAVLPNYRTLIEPFEKQIVAAADPETAGAAYDTLIAGDLTPMERVFVARELLPKVQEKQAPVQTGTTERTKAVKALEPRTPISTGARIRNFLIGDPNSRVATGSPGQAAPELARALLQKLGVDNPWAQIGASVAASGLGMPTGGIAGAANYESSVRAGLRAGIDEAVAAHAARVGASRLPVPVRPNWEFGVSPAPKALGYSERAALEPGRVFEVGGQLPVPKEAPLPVTTDWKAFFEWLSRQRTRIFEGEPNARFFD
jgi:hypothetical protein